MLKTLLLHLKTGLEILGDIHIAEVKIFIQHVSDREAIAPLSLAIKEF